MKVIPGLGTLGTVVFVAYIFLADSPEERIKRTCDPIAWTGDLVHSTAYAFNSEASTLDSITSTDIQIYNSCKDIVWSFFYKDDFDKELVKQTRNNEIRLKKEAYQRTYEYQYQQNIESYLPPETNKNIPSNYMNQQQSNNPPRQNQNYEERLPEPIHIR